MALIKVNHKTLRNVADAIEDYCKQQDKGMKDANASVKVMLATGYKGEDAKAFKESWNKVDDKDSTAARFKDSLKNYAKCLRACANEYQRAQEDSYNQAYKLWR